MYQSTRGIVFRQTRYSDTSIVVRILTEESGLQSFIIKGASRPKAKIRASLFQPLTLLDLVTSHKEKSELQHIREARVAYAYHTIYQDIRKSSILLFLDELLYKSIREEAANRGLFRFIFEILVMLDQTTDNPANLHLLFAVHLTHHLGFFPHGKYSGGQPVFDLTEGQFLNTEPVPAANFISGDQCRWFARLLETVPRDFNSLVLPAVIRSELLDRILQYYRLHLPISGEFRSHTVLHEVLQK